MGEGGERVSIAQRDHSPKGYYVSRQDGKLSSHPGSDRSDKWITIMRAEQSANGRPELIVLRVLSP
ncbi:hypothetical protein AA11237_3499 [Acidocella aminolytica 101 = DSM 11237]|nr:hypothetical protein AA11237_3499 [Acidocella aminolytica 101 = DSM 11237]